MKYFMLFTRITLIRKCSIRIRISVTHCLYEAQLLLLYCEWTSVYPAKQTTHYTKLFLLNKSSELYLMCKINRNSKNRAVNVIRYHKLIRNNHSNDFLIIGILHSFHSDSPIIIKNISLWNLNVCSFRVYIVCKMFMKEKLSRRSVRYINFTSVSKVKA